MCVCRSGTRVRGICSPCSGRTARRAGRRERGVLTSRRVGEAAAVGYPFAPAPANLTHWRTHCGFGRPQTGRRRGRLQRRRAVMGRRSRRAQPGSCGRPRVCFSCRGTELPPGKRQMRGACSGLRRQTRSTATQFRQQAAQHGRWRRAAVKEHALLCFGCRPRERGEEFHPPGKSLWQSKIHGTWRMGARDVRGASDCGVLSRKPRRGRGGGGKWHAGLNRCGRRPGEKGGTREKGR